MKFTEGCAAKIHVPAGKREVVTFEDGTPGFGIRKFADRRAIYFVRYSVAGTRRKLVLGPCKPGVLVAMRKRAIEIVADAKRGADPVSEKKVAAKATKAAKDAAIGPLVETYLAKREGELKPRSFEEVERHLRKQWALLHGRDVRSITRADLVKVVDAIAKNSGTTAADRAKASMSTFLGWCVEQQLIDANPIGGIKRRADGGSRERVLTEAELVAIWKACNEDDHGWIVRLLMLTAQRREEFGGLLRDEVDFDKREIRLPGERTKNGRAHTIPLSDAAVAILQASPQRGRRKLVFGRGEGGFSGWSRSKERLDARLPEEMRATRLNAKGEEEENPNGWTLHDLRRTFATLSADHGFADPHIIEAMLNHQSGSKGGIAGIYNRANYERGKRQLADRWAEHITALVEGRASNIVPLKVAG
jgi:integrase